MVLESEYGSSGIHVLAERNEQGEHESKKSYDVEILGNEISESHRDKMRLDRH